MNNLILSPDETLNQLGTKEEFEGVRMREKINSLPSSLEPDKDGEDLLEEKLNQNHQEEMMEDLED